MSVRIRATLPKGDKNGLAHLEEALAFDPDEIVVVVGILRPDTIEARPHDEDDPRVVKTVLLHVEALTAADAAEADRMIHAAYERRTGKVMLPFEDDEG